MSEMFQITENIYGSVSKFKGQDRIDIRKYFDNTMGETLPTQKGINLSTEQWDVFITKLPELQAYIAKELGT